MIVLFQAIISLILTIVYAINIDFSFSIINIFKVLLCFLVINIGFIILILLAFVAFVYLTQKLPKDNMLKHKLYNYFNTYIFNFLYRVKPIIIGKENLPENSNFVVYSNHIEYTDPLYIKQAYKKYPLAYVTKEELYKYFLVKNILSSTGCIKLSRKTGDRQALQAILQAISQVKNGQPIGIFPEGTRSHTNTMGQFKSGSFKIAQKAGADISITVLYNMHKTIDIFKILNAKVYIKILPLIKYDEIKDMDTNTLSDFVYNKMCDELNTFKEI
ncbi:MAG: lysophospholipid acyltransferase family protein [Candidatus Izemoplasmatales bacterium]